MVIIVLLGVVLGVSAQVIRAESVAVVEVTKTAFSLITTLIVALGLLFMADVVSRWLVFLCFLAISLLLQAELNTACILILNFDNLCNLCKVFNRIHYVGEEYLGVI